MSAALDLQADFSPESFEYALLSLEGGFEGPATDAMLMAFNDLEISEKDILDYSIYDGRPLEFIQEVLGVELWEGQKRIVLAVLQHRKVFVRAGHGVGKTFLLACLVLYWIYAHRGNVVSTAPSEHAVEELLWDKIHELRRNAKYFLPAVGENKRSIRTAENKGLGKVGAKHKGASGISGEHHPRLLAIFDEAYGVDSSPTWAGFLSQAAGEQNRVVAVGNPEKRQCIAAKHDFDGTWHRMNISCLEHPNIVEGREVIEGSVSPSYADDVRATDPSMRGEYRIRVLGEYPFTDSQNIAAYDAVLGCILKAPEPGDLEAWLIWQAALDVLAKEPLRIGLDVAYRGSDSTCLCFRRGNRVLMYERYQGRDHKEIAGIVATHLRDNPGATVNVDTSEGHGWSVVNELDQETEFKRDQHVFAINFGENPVSPEGKEKYKNRRAEMYHGGLKDRIDNNRLFFPDVPEIELLAHELENTEWGTTPAGLIILIPKKKIRQLIGRSPDIADATALSFIPTSVQSETAGLIFA